MATDDKPKVRTYCPRCGKLGTRELGLVLAYLPQEEPQEDRDADSYECPSCGCTFTVIDEPLEAEFADSPDAIGYLT